ncbi:MAG TPA: hypothetical protein VGP53_05940, partial [Acidimicrobiales bacterium]|nr:hypothetical protein [Acidimicrobiales bacterium]
MEDPIQDPDARGDLDEGRPQRFPSPPRVLVSVGDPDDPSQWDVVVVDNDAIDDDTALRIAQARTGQRASLPSLDEQDVFPGEADGDAEPSDAFSAADAFTPVPGAPALRRRFPDPDAAPRVSALRRRLFDPLPRDDGPAEAIVGSGLVADDFAAPPPLLDPEAAEAADGPDPIDPEGGVDAVETAAGSGLVADDFAAPPPLVGPEAAEPDVPDPIDPEAGVEADLAAFPAGADEVEADGYEGTRFAPDELDYASTFGPVGDEGSPVPPLALEQEDEEVFVPPLWAAGAAGAATSSAGLDGPAELQPEHGRGSRRRNRVALLVSVWVAIGAFALSSQLL